MNTSASASSLSGDSSIDRENDETGLKYGIYWVTLVEWPATSSGSANQTLISLSLDLGDGLGALIALVDMIQVFALNMTYDFGLKQISFHLILLSLFGLLGNRMRRLSLQPAA